MTEANDLDAMLDREGFLTDPGRWSPDLAEQLARRVAIGELEEAHWRVIDRLREQFEQAGKLPVQKTLCRELELEPDCLLALFGGPIEAWTVAGLPNPGEEARLYMADMEENAQTGYGTG
jgi:tRNA 2-thiouridine synthesizing protein E